MIVTVDNSQRTKNDTNGENGLIVEIVWYIQTDNYNSRKSDGIQRVAMLGVCNKNGGAATSRNRRRKRIPTAH